MATFKLTIENKFHGTSEEIEISSFQISATMAKKVWKDLCGFRHCRCSNALGQRGSITDEFGGRYEFMPSQFGGGFLQLVNY